MDALDADDGIVAFDADRCIGCGLCVSTCPNGALTLGRKPGGERDPLPLDLSADWHEIVHAQERRART
jgi:Fe-S-cluster-containing hydrogenase component 2